MTNYYLAIISTFIALTSLILAISVFKANQKHNKLSVAPCLSFDLRISKWSELSIVLINNGIGPGIILNQKFKIDEDYKPKTEGKCDNGWMHVKQKLIEEGISAEDFFGRMVGSGEGIQAGKELIILEVTKTKSVYKMIELLPRLYFEVEYSSFYKESPQTAFWDGKGTNAPVEEAKKKLAEIENLG